jgi:hypothetical protein
MAQVTPKQIARDGSRPRARPRAVLAVAKQEGLGGGIGDNGTSFGPFQLHYGGAYPSGAPHGAAASQAWAWSPHGIAYALGQMKGVAGGQRGAQAVKSIVTRFERPADPASEIQGALAAYGRPEKDQRRRAVADVRGGPRTRVGVSGTGAPDNRRRSRSRCCSRSGSETPTTRAC